MRPHFRLRLGTLTEYKPFTPFPSRLRRGSPCQVPPTFAPCTAGPKTGARQEEGGKTGGGWHFLGGGGTFIGCTKTGGGWHFLGGLFQGKGPWGSPDPLVPRDISIGAGSARLILPLALRSHSLVPAGHPSPQSGPSHPPLRHSTAPQALPRKPESHYPSPGAGRQRPGGTKQIGRMPPPISRSRPPKPGRYKTDR